MSHLTPDSAARDDETGRGGMVEIVLPELLPGMKEGRIARWHLSEGARVEAGDILADIATAGATVELEAKTGGRIARILHRAGDTAIAVATPIATLHREPDRRETAAPTAPAVPKPTPSATVGAAMAPAAGNTGELPAGACETRSYREALRDALAEEMGRDDNIFVIGVDVARNSGAAAVTQGLVDTFGTRRVVDTPPLDGAVMGLAIGAAMAGLRPVVSLEHFEAAAEAMDKVIAAALKSASCGGPALPIVFRGPDGWSPGMGPGLSASLCALLSQIPGLTVLAPATPADAKGLMKAALRASGPVAVIEHDLLYAMSASVPHDPDWVLPIGKAVLARPGRDVTVVTYGQCRSTVLEAADLLAAQGIEAEVVDLRTLAPLDMATVIASLRKTGCLVTVEEGWPQGSIGSEVAARAAMEALGALKRPPIRLTGAPCAVPFAESLERAALPSAHSIAAAVKAAF